MQISEAGLVFLARNEGIVPGPYRDSTGIWTFGIGHTAAAGPPDPEQMPRGMPDDLDGAIAEAVRVFVRDVARYAAEVLAAVHVPLAQHEFDALVSFHYNTGAIARAELTRRLNDGDRVGAAAAFMHWCRPASIVPRRQAERDLFATGQYPTGTVPVWRVLPSGAVVWRSVRRLSEDELLRLIREAGPPPERPQKPQPRPVGLLARLILAIVNLLRRWR